MTDAKELLAEIDSVILGPTYDDATALIEIDGALQKARDWIERWAPVVDAACAEAKAADTVIDSHNTYMHTQSFQDYRAHEKAGNTLRKATKTLREAVAKALREDKP